MKFVHNYTRLYKINPRIKQSFFLFGPRGTGKTTWLKLHFPDALYIDLLSAENYLPLSANPHRIENFIPPNYKGIIIIDEVQRIPQLLNEVHRLIESKSFRFILTGSSVRSLRKKGVNLLAGRAFTYYFHPLTVQELGDDFSLEKSLQFGFLPSVYQTNNPAKYLQSYLQTYLREEVLQEGISRSMAQFSRFLEVASFSQAGLINVSEIAREVGMDRKTVENYFQVLEDLLIAYRIGPFLKRAKRRLSVGDKFFFFDCGVFRALRPKGFLDSPEEIEGQSLETLLFQEIVALRDNLQLSFDIYYWRTSNGQEVDFVLYSENLFVVIEVKRKASLKSSDFKGLKLFLTDYPTAEAYMVCGVSTRQYEDNISIIPFGIFLKDLPSLLQKK